MQNNVHVVYGGPIISEIDMIINFRNQPVHNHPRMNKRIMKSVFRLASCTINSVTAYLTYTMFYVIAIV
jgi:hypothetical protein